MLTYTVGEFKTHFSTILDKVLEGEKIAIAYGKKKEIVAFLVPRYTQTGEKRPLGLLEGKGTVIFKDDFKMTEEEFLGE
ncbi:MAG: hypothetical protein JNK77_15380 [Saprospiraceae bacterium]|jgi:antitoxin (DNA-binding transcriptional repressor) of toxin-antitoxin stability system|nr:hypothetical protein [Saprospiraceae bacterium]NUQ26299.1 prevent-host-death protein [Saprospiraceae bacterium]